MFKRRLNCHKVTLLKEMSPGVFVAHCLEYDPAERIYHSLGYFQLDAANCPNYGDE
jgi:hypothetical protein